MVATQEQTHKMLYGPKGGRPARGGGGGGGGYVGRGKGERDTVPIAAANGIHIPVYMKSVAKMV